MKKTLLIFPALFVCCYASAQQEKKASTQHAANVSVKTEALPVKGGSSTVQDVSPFAEASYTLSVSPSLDPNITPAVIPVIPKEEPPKKYDPPSGSNPKK